MNNLSWIIYLSDVLPRAAGFLGFVASILFFAIAIGGIFLFVASLEAQKAVKRVGVLKEDRIFLEFARQIYFTALIILLIIGPFSLLTPSKDTILLMAGSEAAESVVTSKEGQEILNDVKQVIKKQLEALK